jgi:phosphate transport system substrate-binding protein
LVETGSTLLYPLFNVWASEQNASGGKDHHGGYELERRDRTGDHGAAHIGTSDAYMSDAQIKQNPQIINVPMAISAQTVNYNVPDLNAANLKFDGPCSLASIQARFARGMTRQSLPDPPR